MLTIGGGAARGGFCDGVRRRDFLRVGGLGLGGLALPRLLEAEARAGITRGHKAVIMVFLPGGPGHQDTVDLKPEMPEAIRGEFRPIPTRVPGLDLCEHLPRLAAMADKLAVIRSITGCKDEHTAHHCLTGFTAAESAMQGGRPALGSVVARLQGPVAADVPPFVGLATRMKHAPWSDPGSPGYLGLAHAAYAPFRAEGDGPASAPPPPERLSGRRRLLAALDGFRRVLDSNDAIAGMDSYTRQAFEILGSGRLARALDTSAEEARVRDLYGVGDATATDDGAPLWNEQFLMARRLVEAGARCVTLAFGRWDNHSNNFPRCRDRLPKLDRALSALIQDLHDRGLDRDVSVIAWGEFGRAPRVNPAGGREHWPAVSCALLAGGGMRTGQVIGATDRDGGAVRDRPVPMQSVFATLYHNLGIDPNTAVPDRSGRPRPLLDQAEPIRELI